MKEYTRKWKVFAREDATVQAHNVANIELGFKIKNVIWCDYHVIDAVVEEDKVEYSE